MAAAAQGSSRKDTWIRSQGKMKYYKRQSLLLGAPGARRHSPVASTGGKQPSLLADSQLSQEAASETPALPGSAGGPSVRALTTPSWPLSWQPSSQPCRPSSLLLLRQAQWDADRVRLEVLFVQQLLPSRSYHAQRKFLCTALRQDHTFRRRWLIYNANCARRIFRSVRHRPIGAD